MFKNKLTMTPKFVKLLGIDTLNDYNNFVFSAREIKEMIDSAIRKKRKIYDHLSFLKIVEEEYGSIAKLTYWFYNLSYSLYEPMGTYKNMFDYGMLTADIRQKLSDRKDGYYDLDILRIMGDELINFLESSDIRHTDRIKNHFKNVKIKTDDREYIDRTDKEYEIKISKLFNILQDYNNEHEGIEMIEIDRKQSNLNNFVFLNSNENEILNTEELKEMSDELIDLLDEFRVFDLLSDEFKNLYTLYENNNKIDIQLHVCTNYTVAVPKDSYYFSDMMGHPKYVLDEFEKSIERFKKSEKTYMIVDTYMDHIVNYICWLVGSGKAQLVNDEFEYTDNTGKKYKLSINEDGKFIPDFPDGFFDITLKKIYELNTNV